MTRANRNLHSLAFLAWEGIPITRRCDIRFARPSSIVDERSASLAVHDLPYSLSVFHAKPLGDFRVRNTLSRKALYLSRPLGELLHFLFSHSGIMHERKDLSITLFRAAY